MKKLYYLIILTVILGLVLTGCSLLSNIGQAPATEQSGITYLTKHTEDDPFKTDLIADGGDPELAIVVGDVLVWNDVGTLYVKYVITDSDWCLTETHLAVATSLVDIPQKNGNPIPGKFLYQCYYDEDEGKWVLKIKDEGNEGANCDAAYLNLIDPCLSTITYTIPLTWDLGTELFIAAHAVVEKSWTESITIVSNAGDMVYGPTAGYYQINDFASWGVPKLAFETWMHSAWPWRTDPDGAKWISTSYLIGQDGGSIPDSSWRWFHEEFVIPDNSEILSANLLSATADNAEEVYFNGILVGWDGEIQGDYHDDHEWATIKDYDIDPVTGENTLDFIVRNYPGSTSPTDNPTGLIYKTTIDYEVTETETAWADGLGFLGKNWATYFTYTVPLHQIEVLAVSSEPVLIILDAGDYKFVVSGTAFAGDTIEFDAKYSITNRIPGDTWTDTVSGYEYLGTELLDLFVNGAPVNWGDYNGEHIYEYLLTGWMGGAVTFYIYDTYPINNLGHLIVEIYKQP
jgi:hypothetical protein